MASYQKQTAAEDIQLDAESIAQLTQETIDSLVQAGTLDAAFANQVARIFSTQNSMVVEGNYARFHYGGSTFPKEQQNTGKIEIGKPMFMGIAAKIYSEATAVGLELSPRQCQELAVK